MPTGWPGLNYVTRERERQRALVVGWSKPSEQINGGDAEAPDVIAVVVPQRPQTAHAATGHRNTRLHHRQKTPSCLHPCQLRIQEKYLMVNGMHPSNKILTFP